MFLTNSAVLGVSGLSSTEIIIVAIGALWAGMQIFDRLAFGPKGPKKSEDQDSKEHTVTHNATNRLESALSSLAKSQVEMHQALIRVAAQHEQHMQIANSRHEETMRYLDNLHKQIKDIDDRLQKSSGLDMPSRQNYIAS